MAYSDAREEQEAEMKTHAINNRWESARTHHIEMLLKERELCGSSEHDADGRVSNRTSGRLRSLAVLAACFDADRARYRGFLAEGVHIWLPVLRRAANGAAISWSYLTLNNYQRALDALACGEFDVAAQMVELFHSEAIKQIVLTNDYRPHPFEAKMGRMISAIILDAPDVLDAADEWEQYASSKDRDFVAYATLVRAIHTRDAAKANAALAPLLMGHRKQTRRGIFKNSVDELLAIWAIGLVNLARSKGMDVSIEDEMLPGELLVPVAM
jgi:hypothetical protein